LVFLIDPHIFRLKGGVCKVGGPIRVSYPASPHGQIQNEVHIVVKGGRIWLFHAVRPGGKPVSLLIKRPAVHIPAQQPRLPEQGEVVLVLSGDPAGGVGDAAVPVECFDRANQQLPVSESDIVPTVHIPLQLLVDPTRFVQLHVPVAPVQFGSIKPVLKNQIIALIGK